MADTITIPAPHVPFGPKDVPREQADANYLREAAWHIRDGYAVGGHNLTRTVVNLLLDAAEALDGGKAVRDQVRDDRKAPMSSTEEQGR